MISREEFAIMQRQMVEMNDEKLDMIAQIRSLKESIPQISGIKQKVDEAKASFTREESIYKEKVAKTQNKVSAITDQLRSEDDPNRQKTWDEKRLMKIDKSLQELIAESNKKEDIVTNQKTKLNEYNSKTEKLSQRIHKIEKTNKHNKHLMKKIRSFGAISSQINELESRLNQIYRAKNKCGKRIENQNLSIFNLSKSNDSLQEQLDSSEAALQTVNASINTIEPENEATQNNMKQLIFQKNEIDLKNEEADELYQKVKQETEVIIEEKNKEKYNILADFENSEKQISEMKQLLDQYSIEHTILVNKKIALIDQLKRSIKDKVADITRARNDSPHVRRLIESQEQHWMERQQLFESFSIVSQKHHQITETVARKALILSELIQWMETVPRADVGDPMAELDIAYQTATKENRDNAAAIAALTKQLELVENENSELKSQL